MEVLEDILTGIPLVAYAAVFAVLMVFTFLLRVASRGKFGVGLARTLFFLLIGIFVAFAFSLTMNFYTYHRLTYEQQLALVEVRSLEPQLFQVSITYPSEPHYQRSFELKGDQWQMDAEVLKWKGWASLLGLNTLYRLDRISGRYNDIEQARENLPSLYSIKDEQGFDLWAYAKNHPEQLPFIDASYGSATYMPMIDGAKYEVSLSQTGLLARPVE